MLTTSGCLVWRRHFRKIEELYQLADLYVFPVIDRLGSIELPLSVMEAMSCNLLVVSTKFGALPRILKEEDGLIFIDEVDAIPLKIEQVKKEKSPIRTREKVILYSWENVIKSLVGCFQKLVED
jgi:glycosyltransferase involved in cell wall biosynthesis